MRCFCLLWLAAWVLATRPALAQAPLPTLQPAALAAAPPDTAAALHRLFVDQRSRRTVVVGGVLVASGLVAGLIAVNRSPNSWVPIQAGVVGLLAVPFAVIGLVDFGRHYSRRRERQAIEALRAHRLPAELRQQLRPRFFPQPTS